MSKSSLRIGHFATWKVKSTNAIRGKGLFCFCFVFTLLNAPKTEPLLTQHQDEIPSSERSRIPRPRMNPGNDAVRRMLPSPAVAGQERQHVRQPTPPAWVRLAGTPRLAPVPEASGARSTATAQECWGGSSSHPPPSSLGSQ